MHSLRAALAALVFGLGACQCGDATLQHNAQPIAVPDASAGDGDAGLLANDAGAATDGGEDAGRDAGGDVDAGAADAGVDGGEPVDAGAPDAGVELDAGLSLDAGQFTCHSCHGTPVNDAPPIDTLGRTATSLRTVGAHQPHLARGGGWHREVDCTDCHVVPTANEDPGHLDPGPAEVTFGPVARARNVAASFDGARCTAWCHGVGLDGGGGRLTQPEWTQVGAMQATCGTCHGVPPPPPHPGVTNYACGGCHPNAGPSLTFSAPERHIDGVLDVVTAVTCTTCHGITNPAPPRDTSGGTATTLRTVGAHQSHLGPSTWHRQVDCTDCHVVPTAVGDSTHLDRPPAELTWSLLARAQGVAAGFDGGTCATYCHGATLSGPLTTPQWTRVDGTQAACGTTCHTSPPAAPHPQYADCARCHPTMDGGTGFAQPERHIDGVVDVDVSCTACHGGSGSPAPPSDVSGNVSTSARGVGAHRSHLGPSGWHAEVTCEDCHDVPVTVGEPGHLGPLPAEVAWGALALSRGASPTWNGVTCTNAYCHGGAFDGGAGSNTTPQWTRVDGTQAACGTCHALPPAGRHPNNPLCSVCHGSVIQADGGFVNPALHVNGLVEAQATCGTCHALPPATGAHLTHASLAAPVYGALGTAAALPAPTAYGFGCGLCHPMDATLHANAQVEVELSNPLAPPASLKALSPQGQYTRGGVTYLDATGLPYTLGTCTNVYCHSAKAWETPSGVPAPGADFTFAGYPIVYPPYSLVVSRQFRSIGWGSANPGCGGCHGLPPRTTSAQVAAMAGNSHSWIDSSGYENGHGWNHGFTPLSCRTCHAQTVTAANTTTRDPLGVATYGAVPIASFALHVNGRPDVVFDTVNPLPYRTPRTLTTASWSAANATCSNVSCHFAQTTVQSGAPYRYDNGWECNVCHRY